ncbi:hypothetical protein [Leptolyngbya sp. FACHB-261]|uniref:hypothetical protein n=1 Tax=Leptolyngbya sp. FACHB-261 TaxID=2692806 RepID=UPI0016886BE2|nr:hypothetical protein [Leptolyngbya sp. FACHB-261]MBD2102489.1 hypothetical protein [Leptolyngbya sp. FACHB-261]
MSSTQSTELRSRLLPQAVALVERALGGANDSQVVEALLDACSFLEESAQSDAPIVALERDVRTETGTYHLFIRRLSSSVPAGKFQILITCDLASGLIY